jgi:hypothetical protein
MVKEINKPEVILEVKTAFTKYEQALINNDVTTMNLLFWNAPETIRYGIAEIQHGSDAIYMWRANAQPVSPERQLHHTVITTFGTDFATVSTEFDNGVETLVHGRQMQTWVRLGSNADIANGWKIVAAHVSLSQ